MVLELSPPGDLSEQAAPVWAALVPYLCEKAVLVPADVPLLVELVETLGLARQYRRALQRLVASPWLLGLDPDSDDSSIVGLPADALEALALATPAVKRLRSGYVECMARASSLASCFGLTPTDRIRLGVASGRDGGATLQDVIGEALRLAFADGATKVEPPG